MILSVLKKAVDEEGESTSKSSIVQVLHDIVFPRCVVGFLQVKEHCEYMLCLHESFANKAFKPHQLIPSASVFAEATLHIRDKFAFFQVPDQSVIDHAFDYFTETTLECYRVIVA